MKGACLKCLPAPAGTTATLLAAGWSDRASEMDRVPNPSASFDAIVSLWVATNVLFAGLLLLLAWLVIRKNGGNALVLVSLLIVSPLLLLSSILPRPLSVLPPFLLQRFTGLLPAAPSSQLFRAIAFITVIGLMGLVVRRRM